MKRYSLSMFLVSAILLGSFVVFYCGKSNPASPVRLPSDLDKEITGTWRFTLDYNADTTIHIVLTYDSTYAYKINVNINDVDTMERENGSWRTISDTVSKADTVWMSRHNCHQINLQTGTLDSVVCGIDTAGIKLNITTSGSQTVWVIPLNDFAGYLPAGIAPPGVTLPTGRFFKD
jgi:hypothetical protein